MASIKTTEKNTKEKAKEMAGEWWAKKIKILKNSGQWEVFLVITNDKNEITFLVVNEHHPDFAIVAGLEKNDAVVIKYSKRKLVPLTNKIIKDYYKIPDFLHFSF